MEKKKIQQVIVVEGKHDSERLKTYFDCDTIETNGKALTVETVELIRRVQKERGVIVFTDPDAPGNKIRNIVNSEVPGCLNAYVNKVNARTTKKVGIEHANKEVLQEALENLISYTSESQEITMQDLYELGLAGRDDSSRLRELVGEKLHIGGGNAKTFRNRLNCLGIHFKELKETVHEQ